MGGQPGFFDVDERLRRLSDLGDQLLAFAEVVDFEIFRPELAKALAYSDGAQGGRPPFDPVMMFKILVIQAANTLSDERAEFLINDRLSFMRFLGLGLSDRVPDARTIWLFREKLTRAGAIKPLFDRFDAALREAGYIAMGGPIIDASLIAAPKQRNTEAEKAASGKGAFPRTGRPGPPSSPTRIATRAGRSSSARPRSAPTTRRRPSTSPFRHSATRRMARPVCKRFCFRPVSACKNVSGLEPQLGQDGDPRVTILITTSALMAIW